MGKLYNAEIIAVFIHVN